jgi:curved DNA-binding protein
MMGLHAWDGSTSHEAFDYNIPVRYKDYYATLGVGRDADADTIKKAYRKLARRYHPDVSKEPDAEARFKEINEAYEVLGNPEKRRAYDGLGSGFRDGEEIHGWPGGGAGPGGPESPFGNASFEDILSSLFGGLDMNARRGGPFGAKGADLRSTLSITLEEAFSGTSKELHLGPAAPGDAGTGKVIKVTIPPGTLDGDELRVEGQGGAGARRPGDLYLRIKILPHRLFSLDGRHFQLDMPITPSEAALGTSLTVPTLACSVEVRVPPLTQTGTKLRLKGRGMPGHPPGDQFLLAKIMIPTPINEQARKLYEELAKESPQDVRSAWSQHGRRP